MGQAVAPEHFDYFDDRVFILKISLKIEHSVSEYLAQLLEVKEPKVSFSFSNKSSALSFNQKINLLIDIGALTNDKKNVLITFMEIRNQFMHNVFAVNFVECIKQVEGKKSYLLKRYPQDTSLLEEKQIEGAIYKLCFEAFEIVNSVVSVINSKVIDTAMNNVTSLLAMALITTNISVREEFNKMVDQNEKSAYTRDEVKSLYLQYTDQIFQIAMATVSKERGSKENPESNG